MTDSANNTPMMRQFIEAKAQHPDCILLFRMGDFYETFFEDAEIAARELELTLTSRDKNAETPVPMAGVPHHAAEGYIRRLVERGYRVAICEQLESPQKAKGIVRRGVTRVVTPGSTLDLEGLDARRNNFLVAIAVSSPAQADVVALSAIDLTTGEFRVCELQGTQALVGELRRVAPAELLVAEGHEVALRAASIALGVPVTRRPDASLSLQRALRAAERNVLAVSDGAPPLVTLSTADLQERLTSIDEFALRDRAAVDAAIALSLDYVLHTQGGVPRSLARPVVYRSDEFVTLDPASEANLEIFETLMGGRKAGSLFSVVDQTVSSAGSRRLRTWLSYPLVDPEAIGTRQRAVSRLVERLEVRERLRTLLKDCHDIKRIGTRLSAGQGNARDLQALAVTLSRVPQVRDLATSAGDPLISEIAERLDARDALRDRVASAIVDNPPVTITEGEIIREGYSGELDELIALTRDAKSWLLEFEARERKETGIGSLKVRHNKVFGYYIEITKANVHQVPEDRYVRRQTLTNAERYVTTELQEKEEAISTAAERRSKLEYELFEALRAEVIESLPALQETAESLSELDAFSSLAELSHRRGYVCPEVTDTPGIEIRAGRHPVVETMVEGERFVPNDVRITPDERLLIITGPNMAGKSTVIRQVALITLLAQVGSHVPAASARIGVVDQIFSRVGASDNLARGQSTFMVEMTETAHILSRATERSLVILDEIGRGTATYDGLSIAWAVAEHLHDTVEAMTLFATHYHELTDLARTRPAVRNYNIAAKEWNEQIIFLHTLVEGPANRSYGIQVARLAGVPESVVSRAREVLSNLEQAEYGQEDEPVLARTAEPGTPRRRPSPQLHLFGEASTPVEPSTPPMIRELAELPLDAMSPIEALNTLFALQKRARKQTRS